MLVNEKHLAEINAPKQTIRGRVELLRGSTLERICTCSDILSELTVERTGEGKFFGFGICQKLRAVLIDMEGDLNITTEHAMDVAFGVDSDYIHPFPRFYVQDVERDEVANTITLTGYDILYKAEKFKVSDLHIEAPYTIRAMTAACAHTLNVPLTFVNVNEDTFMTNYPEGANFGGTESVRAVLNGIAEATQTIYYVNDKWELVFRRLDRDTEPALTINKKQYMELASGESRTLSNIAHVTELGDNTATIGDDSGVTQFVRENPFWNLREDIDDILLQAQENISELSITQFEAYWSGNYLLEIGDKIEFIKNDDTKLSTYILDDAIYYAGTLEETTKWEYDENEGETITNPVSLGDALNQTYARVDKVNQRITMLVEKTDEQARTISQLVIDTEGITSTVSSIEETTSDSIDSLNNSIETLTKTVETKTTPEQVLLSIKTEIEKGVDKVETSTGYTFDADGLTVSKSGSEMTTQITEDGMTVYRDNSAVLVANNKGVEAENLHATTYLIIGSRSRFENYESNRTGCFWIGGTD